MTLIAHRKSCYAVIVGAAKNHNNIPTEQLHTYNDEDIFLRFLAIEWLVTLPDPNEWPLGILLTLFKWLFGCCYGRNGVYSLDRDPLNTSLVTPWLALQVHIVNKL